MVAPAYAPTHQRKAPVAINGVRFDDDRAFCQQVNLALEEAGFDAWLETLCRPYAAAENRSPISFGMYFRLILIAYLKENGYPNSPGIKTDSRNSPIEMLGVSSLLPSREGTNPASSVYRLPLEVHRQVFAHALGIITDKGLLEREPAIPAPAGVKRRTLLTGLVHKETGDDWTADIE